VLQGYGPTISNVVRTNLARALEQLAALVGLGARSDGEMSQAARSAAEAAFGHDALFSGGM
jgi:hypothetical protein